MRRAAAVFISLAAVLFLFCLFSFKCSAYDPDKAMEDIKGLIPSDAAEYIPDSLFDTESGRLFSDPGLLLGAALKFTEAALGPVLSVFSVTLGFVILASVFSLMRQNVLKGSLAAAFDFISVICMALCLYSVVWGLWSEAEGALERLNLFMNGMLPVMTGLYAAGGELATSAVNSAGMMAVLTLFGNITSYALWPALRICFGLSLAGCVGGIKLDGVSSLVRNTFSIAVGFVTALLTFILNYQTKLALSADNAAARTIKFAAGSFIPVVGGAVSEAARIILGSFSYIKSAAGVIGAICVALIVLPVLIRLFLYKIALGVTAAAAKVLGCEREGAFIGEMNGLLNIAIGLVSACSMLFIFNLTLFIKAAGGGV